MCKQSDQSRELSAEENPMLTEQMELCPICVSKDNNV